MEIFGREQYEWTHGKRPRGTGSWAFMVPGRKDPVWKNGKLGDCLAELRKEGFAWVKILT